MKNYIATYHSPIGEILLESDGEALTALRFRNSGNGTIAHPMLTQITISLPVFNETRRWLDDYFSGKRTENAVVDAKTDERIAVRPKGTAFQQRVWQALLTIPYGKTVSYGELARMVGCKSAQAVGQAVGANPVALLIPCHRIIAAHGRIGGYEYGIEIKKRLLELEQR
ncbi:MAG: methylated-DNA--[Paludibacteraceae bacterium]|nr:methylated-DNA--[protein]-cysteine S-methyltransferase [Paludibacteraceae bacterium]